MAIQTLDTLSTTQIALGGSDDFFMTENGALAVDTNAVFGNTGSHSVAIHGDVMSFLSDGIRMFQTSYVDILIGEGASVHSAGSDGMDIYAYNAVLITNMGTISSSANYAVNIYHYDLNGADFVLPISFNNAGTISVTRSTNTYAAVNLDSGEGVASFNNSGQVLSSSTGMILYSTYALAGAYRVINSGEILAAQNGIEVTDGHIRLLNTGTLSSTGEAALELSSDGGFVVNRGTITGDIEATGAGTVVLRNSGVITGDYLGGAGGTDSIVNAGLISGDVTTSSGDDTVENSGETTGSINMGDGNDLLINMGQIGGGVLLGAGNDVFRGYGGTVQGSVQGGGQDDTFYVDQAGIEIDGGAEVDTVYARADVVAIGGVEFIYLEGAGDISAIGDLDANVIEGNVGANHIIGDMGNDTLNGRGGDDILEGWADNDVLRGGDGNDYMDGGTYADTLNGNEGDDTLIGGHGNDLLVGSVGDDRFLGGEGADIIKGGAGADMFVYEAVADSTMADFDRIVGFTAGTDQIDLFDINDDAFDFLGTGAFSGSGAMELRYTVTGTGHALVDLDADGDGNADMRIQLLYVDSLSAADFIL